ncbi:MAG: radical SAM protein [Candidatus Sumerlaeia bacterium]
MRGSPTLAFVDAVNFELTYRCNTACPHCLQQNIRRSVPASAELSAAAVEKAIHDAWFCGLAKDGINLTGGEPLLFRPDVIRLIRYCRTLGLRVRLNTNSWWGRARDFKIGDHEFGSASELVVFLKDCGLTVLALSFDERVEGDPGAFEDLAGVVAACEADHFAYQIVCTGPDENRLLDAHDRLVKRIGAPPRCMIPVMMEKVDIGGAASSIPGGGLDPRLVCALARGAGCKGRGFYRPSLLHVSPAGGVRTCCYAIGMANLGNLLKSTLMDMVNRFPADPVALAFENSRIEAYADKLLRPHAHRYRAFAHPCAACAVLGRLVEQYSSLGREPTPADIEAINTKTANELNLLL